MTQHPEDQNKSIAWKFLIGLGILFFLLGGLTFGFKKFLEYSGAHEWEKTRAMLIGNGVELDLEKLLPDIPPDAENFAATPLIAALVTDYPEVERKRILNNRFREMRIPQRTSVDYRDRKSGLPDFRAQRLADFEEIALTLAEAGGFPQGDSGVPERAIRNWMEQFRTEITDLDEASMRSLAVWPEPPLFDLFVYRGELNDYIDDLGEHHKFQAARALAALAIGNEKEALTALRTMF